MAGEKRAEVFLDVEPGARAVRESGPADPDLPFRILVLANLRGAAERPPLAERAPVRVDRDDFDAVLERMQPQVQIRLDGSDAARVTVRIRDLDDLHPDQLYARLPVFKAMRELRKRLDDPATFRQAVRELTGEPDAPAGPAGGSLLDSILGEIYGSEPASPGQARGPLYRDPLSEFIRAAMSPHLVPGEDPRKAAFTQRIDRGIATMMRAVLHDAGFQAVEAAWRAVHLLVRTVETDASLGVWLLDVTREELDADTELERSALYRTIVEREAGTAGGVPWSLLAGDFQFGPAAGDVALLARLARIAQATRAPFLAGAHPSLAGAPGFEGDLDPADWSTAEAPEWAAFRRSAAARSIGLAAPRFLLRLPYGEDGEPCEAFAFEEAEAPAPHESLLWANPAYACATLLARAFSHAGWRMAAAFDPNLSGLPLYLQRVSGETRAQPCAETLMTERAAGRLLERGLMPLASMRDRDAVRLVRLQSVADPVAALAARW
jgi:type VI secretion system protein ImpC